MKNDDKTQIRNLVENWAKAVREEDLDGILAYHSDDIVVFDVPPPFQSKGIAEYKKTWELFFSWTKKSGVYNITNLEITDGKEVAFCHGVGHCAGIDQNGAKENLEFRLTIGLHKINSQWIITHEHHSLPSE